MSLLLLLISLAMCEGFSPSPAPGIPTIRQHPLRNILICNKNLQQIWYGPGYINREVRAECKNKNVTMILHSARYTQGGNYPMSLNGYFSKNPKDKFHSTKVTSIGYSVGNGFGFVIAKFDRTSGFMFIHLAILDVKKLYAMFYLI